MDTEFSAHSDEVFFLFGPRKCFREVAFGFDFGEFEKGSFALERLLVPGTMSSLSRELVFLILQFLDEEKFKETVHK